MQDVRPFVREQGSGEVVICIHPSTSSSAQWKALSELLSGRFRVLAVDIYGHGKSESWPTDASMSLHDEAEFIERILKGIDHFHIVGHSYGGAIALKLAQRNWARVASVSLFEPALWGTIAAMYPSEEGTKEITNLRDETISMVRTEALERATQRFIDYWSGSGTYESIPEKRRPSFHPAMRALIPGWGASFSEVVEPKHLGPEGIPWLLMSGNRSTKAALLAFDYLRRLMPRATFVDFPGLGHLGPITHPQVVNAAIESFLMSNSK